MGNPKETFIQRWGIVIFAGAVLLAAAGFLLAHFGVFQDDNADSWKQPSLERAMDLVNWVFAMEKDLLQSMRIVADGAFRISEDSTYRGDDTPPCRSIVTLFPVLTRLFLEAAERAKYYHPPYTRNEVKSYLSRNGNQLVVKAELYADYASQLEGYAVLVVQDSTVIRPASATLPPVVSATVDDMITKAAIYKCAVPRYVAHGELLFDVTSLDPDRPFQIKVVKRPREITFDVDFDAFGHVFLRE